MQILIVIYFIILKGMKQSEKNNTRLGWTLQQQNMLRTLYQLQGIKSWIQISNRMNEFTKEISRSPKQCRERYNNFVKLKPLLGDLLQWNQEQNQKLFDLYLEKGSKWVQIAKNIPRRSQNYLKNRFYGSLRKALNSINRFGSQSARKLKPIKYLTLTKILQRKTPTLQNFQEQSEQIKKKAEFCQNLRFHIIQATRNAQLITKERAQNIIQRAHKFNILTRFQNMARNRSFKIVKKKATTAKNLIKQVQKQRTKELCSQVEDEIQELYLKNIQEDKNILEQAIFSLAQFTKNKETNIGKQQNLEADLCMILQTNYQPNYFNFPMDL